MRAKLPFFLLSAMFSAPVQAATIAVPENVAPWGTTADAPVGQRGIYADLADAIIGRSKTPITIRFVPYGRMLEGVRSGEFNYAFGVMAPDALAAAPFTAIIAKVPMVVVARKDLPLKTIADLHHFTEVGYLRGGSCGAQIDVDRAIHRVSQDSYELGIRKLAAGRLDAWCSIKAGFDYTLRRMGMAQSVGDQLDTGAMQIGMQVTPAMLNTPEAKAVGAIVGDLLQDGSVGKVFTRYVGTAYAP